MALEDVKMSKTPIPILLIGPRRIAGDVLGGTKVSFELLIDHFEDSQVWTPVVVNLSRPAKRSKTMRAWASFVTFIGVVLRVARLARHSALIFLNISPQGLLLAGPVLWAISRIVGVPFVVRIFGGDFAEQIEQTGTVTRWIAKRSFLNCELLLLQSKSLVSRFEKSQNVHWFPTSRRLPADHRIRNECRKLLFVSQLRPEKGLRELLSAADALSTEVSVSIFGARMPGFEPDEFRTHSNIRYYGEVSNEVVLKAMQDHDVLIFPTYHEGEGYPGVVIEAMQAGMPIVASRWKALPELVEHEVNGLLVPPRSSIELVAAISRLVEEPGLVSTLSQGALSLGARFDAENVNSNLDQLLLGFVGTGDSHSCAE